MNSPTPNNAKSNSNAARRRADLIVVLVEKKVEGLRQLAREWLIDKTALKAEAMKKEVRKALGEGNLVNASGRLWRIDNVHVRFDDIKQGNRIMGVNANPPYVAIVNPNPNIVRPKEKVVSHSTNVNDIASMIQGAVAAVANQKKAASVVANPPLQERRFKRAVHQIKRYLPGGKTKNAKRAAEIGGLAASITYSKARKAELKKLETQEEHNVSVRFNQKMSESVVSHMRQAVADEKRLKKELKAALEKLHAKYADKRRSLNKVITNGESKINRLSRGNVNRNRNGLRASAARRLA